MLPAAAGSMAFLFFQSANVHYTYEWKAEADVKQAIEIMENKSNSGFAGKKILSAGIDFNFEAPINYYRATRHLRLNPATRENALHPLHDFYFFTKGMLREKNTGWAIPVQKFAATGNVLLANKLVAGLPEIIFSQTINFEDENMKTSVPVSSDGQAHSGNYFYRMDHSSEFGYAMEFRLPDSLKKQTMITYSGYIRSPRPNPDALFILSLENEKGTYLWQPAPVMDYISESAGWFPFAMICMVPDEVRQGDLLKAYVWNFGKEIFFLDDLRLEVAGYDLK
jgi:hypothetical protein